MSGGFDTHGFDTGPVHGLERLKDWVAFAGVSAYLGASYGYLLLAHKLPEPPMRFPKLVTSVALAALSGVVGAREGELAIYAAAGGHAYYARGPLWTTDLESYSRLIVLEDGRPLGPAHASHQDVHELGLGRFSHWDWHYERDGGLLPRPYTKVVFSSSDNSDPRVNGRRYTYAWA